MNLTTGGPWAKGPLKFGRPSFRLSATPKEKSKTHSLFAPLHEKGFIMATTSALDTKVDSRRRFD